MKKSVLASGIVIAILTLVVVLISCSNSSYIGSKYVFNDQSWEELAAYWETDKNERTGKKIGEEITYIFGTMTRPSYSIWFQDKENVIVNRGYGIPGYDGEVSNYTYSIEKGVIVFTDEDGISFGLGSFSKDYRSITIDCPCVIVDFVIAINNYVYSNTFLNASSNINRIV